MKKIQQLIEEWNKRGQKYGYEAQGLRLAKCNDEYVQTMLKIEELESCISQLKKLLGE